MNAYPIAPRLVEAAAQAVALLEADQMAPAILRAGAEYANIMRERRPNLAVEVLKLNAVAFAEAVALRARELVAAGEQAGRA
jgi:hypothetical protein